MRSCHMVVCENPTGSALSEILTIAKMAFSAGATWSLQFLLKSDNIIRGCVGGTGRDRGATNYKQVIFTTAESPDALTCCLMRRLPSRWLGVFSVTVLVKHDGESERESGLSQETVFWMTHGGETVVTFSDPTPATVSIPTLWPCLLRFLPAEHSDSCPAAVEAFASVSSQQTEAAGFCLGFFFF